ncbi:hypothetical protein LS684_21145 (plasmid) [Cytobacillus spongiae]|uniref:hypothetical protein n=1 Tax=Cytobacillus spongiae TaxID=2901381 RepID=UPI001F3A4DAC|nr:hypothetical protein [Cytobacillus spongiae]UII58131.1 hypothetical protein LS684_21145 [Cytobacillus spongiae]
MTEVTVKDQLIDLIGPDHTFKNKKNIYFIEGNAPESPGVFIMYDWLKRPLYIGKANNIKQSLIKYFSNTAHTDLDYIIHNVKFFSFMIFEDKSVREHVKNLAIKLESPPFNIEDNDNYENRYDPKYLLTTQCQYSQEYYLKDPFAKEYCDKTGVELPDEIEEKIQKRLDEAMDRLNL